MAVQPKLKFTMPAIVSTPSPVKAEPAPPVDGASSTATPAPSASDTSPPAAPPPSPQCDPATSAGTREQRRAQELQTQSMRQARTNVLTQEVTLNPGDTAYGLWPKGVPYSKQTLDALNPGTDWKSLRPGTKIILPAAPSQPSTVSRRGSLDSASAPKPNGSADASPQGSGADSERLGQLQKLAEETTTYRQRLGTRQVPTPKAAEAKELIERLNKAQKWVDDAKSNAAALTNKNDIGEQRAELARMKGDLPPIIKTFSGTFYASEPDPEAARAGAALDRLDESADALKEAQQDADKLLKPIPE